MINAKAFFRSPQIHLKITQTFFIAAVKTYAKLILPVICFMVDLIIAL